MSGSTALWLVAGLLSGMLHIRLLWREAHPAWRGHRGGVWRFLGVACLLVGAALRGLLLPIACGWAGGFVLAAVAIYFWKM